MHAFLACKFKWEMVLIPKIPSGDDLHSFNMAGKKAVSVVSGT